MPNLYVVCRGPLPEREDQWSFLAGPVMIAREGQLLRLTSPNFASGLVAEALGELIARGTRGTLLAEKQRLVADYAETSGLDDFPRQLAELLADLEAELEHEANDWSDVESAA